MDYLMSGSEVSSAQAPPDSTTINGVVINVGGAGPPGGSPVNTVGHSLNLAAFFLREKISTMKNTIFLIVYYLGIHELRYV